MASNENTGAGKIAPSTLSLARIIDALSGDKLEKATVDAIGKHRALTESAENAYLAWKNCSDHDPRKTSLLEDYHRASLRNHAQIATVAALTDKLGYTPKLNGEWPQINGG